MTPQGSSACASGEPHARLRDRIAPLHRWLRVLPRRPAEVADVTDTDLYLRRDRERRFVLRMHRMRTLGLGLGFLAVAAVFWQHHEPFALWAALAAHAFAWPHFARSFALRSARPARIERLSLGIDSALGGAWIALMQFSPLPGVLLATMLTVDKIGVGGVRLAARTTVLLAATCALVSMLLGFPVDLATPSAVLAASLPFLVAYPVALAVVMHGLARKVAAQNRRLTDLGRTDELTGLANRAQGFAAAALALARYRRRAGAAVLLILDVDRFKTINDRFGHLAGDDVLREVARIIAACVRATDTAARYAGDEFIVVLSDADLNGAREIAERIRERVARHAFARAPGLRCTVSLGAAQAHWGIGAVEEWVQQADAALYQAKTSGRDRVIGATTFAEERPGRRMREARGAPRSTAATPAADCTARCSYCGNCTMGPLGVCAGGT